MAIYNGPARGGTRGGKDQFNWDDVKEDKYSQNYLGHSVKAPVGRWQNNKDLTWYKKQSKFDLVAAQKAELAAAKERDKDLMAQMLGEKPMEAPKGDMTRIEKNKLYKRGDAEEGTVAAEIAGDAFGERVEGLGYAPIKVDNLREQMDSTTHERQEGTAINDLLKAHAEGGGEHGEGGHAGGEDGHDDQDHAALLAAIEAAGAFGGEGGGDVDPNDKKAMKKRMKKLEKEEKKRKKAEKKAAKREKKEGKRRRDDSDSDSDGSEEKRREPARGDEERRGDRGDDRNAWRERERDTGRREREGDRRRERSRSGDRDRERDRERDRDRERRSRSRSRDRDWRRRRD